jgi:hypothetical protein
MGVVDEMRRMEEMKDKTQVAMGGAGRANTNNPHGRTNKSTTSRAPAPSTCQHSYLPVQYSVYVPEPLPEPPETKERDIRYVFPCDRVLTTTSIIVVYY